jgi:hypothetical protein
MSIDFIPSIQSTMFLSPLRLHALPARLPASRLSCHCKVWNKLKQTRSRRQCGFQSHELSPKSSSLNHFNRIFHEKKQAFWGSPRVFETPIICWTGDRQALNPRVILLGLTSCCVLDIHSFDLAKNTIWIQLNDKVLRKYEKQNCLICVCAWSVLMVIKSILRYIKSH